MTLTKPRPIFKVDFSEKKDDPLDFAFRHYRIMKSDGARLVRTFTGKVPRSQSTRKRVRQDIARWCEIHLRRLPEDGGAIIVDLDLHMEARVMCYKFEMAKTTEQWLLFEYVGRELTLLSKPFETKKQAEKAREKYPERLRKKVGLGVIRIKR
jgi:hypothetical protein